MDNLTVIANEVLPVYETSTGERVVDARELHDYLMISTRFNDWIQRYIANYGFVDNEDFYSFLSKTKGRPSNEFLLTIDTAKEIAMVQNNEIGRAVRKYFIKIEKQSKKPQSMTQLEVLQGAINQMVAQEQRVKQIERTQLRIQQENQVLKHRMDNYDLTNIQGTPRQRLNAMVRRFANQEGVQYGQAWKVFVQAYNTAYGTNLELKRKNYMDKVGKDVSRPQFLEEAGLLEDAIRIADKLLNQKKLIKN
ncbi:antA/AntB antirepressor family protein [Priestia endophytica]|uniref:antA/AntB antirepressor family protein n=1 Tax=Priestia endophytica TaxID=135735 RepID=UPI00203FB691|nr:antA/AntB antirepressor family protein [Priestia endophytica]MCM3536570.1 antA/AntB antirepressor family protein [Priestia endophytica]